MRLLFFFVLVAALLHSAPATALAPEELRFGVVAHNVSFFRDDDEQSAERGPNLEVEIVLRAPRALRRIGSPRPYAMMSVNLNGDTSYAAAGLQWRIPLQGRWTLEAGLGVAVHDGALRNPYASTDARHGRYEREHQLLGTRVLYRESVALERRVDQRRSIALVYEHLSNGGALLGHEHNQSLNQIGMRFSIRFN